MIKQNATYGYDVQKLYLEMLLADPETFVRAQGIFDAELFDRKLRAPAKFVYDYVGEHNSLPTYQIVNAAAGTDLQKPPDLKDEHFDWLLQDFETFIRHKGIERAIIASADLLEEGEYGAVEELVKKAVQVGLTKDLGTDYYQDPRARLMSLKDKSGFVKTGWDSLDQLLYGGFCRGNLNIFAAGSGGGKSLFLANLGVNWSTAGLNVMYISLELSEELVGHRVDAMMTGIASKNIYRELDNVEMKVKMMGKKSGAFQIKYMAAGKTVNDIRAYVKEYETKSQKKVDVLLIDYLDLLMPAGRKVSAENLFIKDKFVSEELRNYAMEQQVILVTAAQLNRCLSLDTQVIANGLVTRIADVKVGDRLDSNNGSVEVLEKLPVTKQPVYKIKTKSGKEIICSANHKFPVGSTLKTIASGLAVGDKLTVRNEQHNNTPKA